MTPARNSGLGLVPGVRSGPDRLPVLYAIACGSPVAGHIGALVTLAQHHGWQVCVVATPDGLRFMDVPGIAAQTGYPVRSQFKNPGDRDILPPADAIVVAPATVNTVNKWACGIADTLALGLLIEAYGLGVPTVAVPYTNTAMAAHPAFRESLARLRAWGVRVLFGEHVVAMPPPGTGAERAAAFPWELALAALSRPWPADADELAVPAGNNGGGPARGMDGASLSGRNRRDPGGGSGRPPSAVPRPAPAGLRRV